MARVQFREDDETVEYLQRKGLNPNKFAQTAFHAAVQRLKAEDKHRRLKAFDVRLSKPAAELVREGRETR